MLKEFRDFAMKGNVVDMTVGVVVAGGFGKVVSSLLNDLIMPPLGLLMGGADFTELKLTLKAASGAEKAVTINYGNFVTNLIDFVIVAFTIFMVIKLVNRLRAEAPAKA
jgi:large conductance mechanosensitive channel